MGEEDYFSKEEQEEEYSSDEVEEQEGEEQDEKFKKEFTEIQRIIAERTRIKEEYEMKKKQHGDRIAIIKLDLKGHPDEKYRSQFDPLIERVKKLLRDGHMRRHPITAEMMKVIDLFERMDDEYDELNLTLDSLFKAIGNLGDKAININIEKDKLIRNLERKKNEVKDNYEKTDEEDKEKEIKERIQDFMEEFGNKYMDKFCEAYLIDDGEGKSNAKRLFMQQFGRTFNKHDNSTERGRDLFERAKKIRLQNMRDNKKKISPAQNQPAQTEQNSAFYRSNSMGKGSTAIGNDVPDPPDEGESDGINPEDDEEVIAIGEKAKQNLDALGNGFEKKEKEE